MRCGSKSASFERLAIVSNTIDEFLADVGRQRFIKMAEPLAPKILKEVQSLRKVMERSKKFSWGGMGDAAVKGLAFASAVTGIGGGAKLVSSLAGKLGKKKAFNDMMEFDPGLKKLDDRSTKAVFGSLHTLAPTAAKDPLLASGFVRRTITMSERGEPYVDVETIKKLTEAQNKMRAAPGFADTFSKGLTSTL